MDNQVILTPARFKTGRSSIRWPTRDDRAAAAKPASALPFASNCAKSAATGAMWRNVMADHGEVQYASATGNDYAAHEETYRNFVKLVKGVLGAVVVILILLAYFIG
jgi:hypothetical protein